MNQNSSQKLILSKKTLSKESSSSPSTPTKQNFPALPAPIRFAPMTPRPRPPFTPMYSSIFSPTPTSTQNSINKISTSKSSKLDSEPIPYIKNPYHHMIKILEPCEVEKVNESFLSLINYLFPRDCHFFNDEYKTREYYQAIFIDSESIIVEHNMNLRDPSKIDFSKVRIRRILTPEEWGSRPYIKKTLAGFPALPYFNYYDYQEAWYKTFLLRNYNHSWFIYFDKDFSNNYPLWFVKWFQYMGICPEAFPPFVLEAFNKFKKYFEKDGTPLFEYTLQFMCVLRLPWIMSWTYFYQEAQTTPLSPPALHRHYRVKWWNKFPSEKGGTQAVDEYYKLCYQTPIQRTIKGESSDIISRIQAASSSPEEIQKIINEIKNSTSGSSNNDQDQFQDAQDPYDDVILSL